MNKADLEALADVRILEAVGLLTLVPPRPDGAYYLAGYAVECALKAVIAATYAQHDWPDKQFVADCHTHDLLKLVSLAQLQAARNAAIAGNPVLGQNWLVVKDWNERSRYERHSQAKAEKMIDAVANAANGVLPWIRGHW